jgi:hypothetical protein
MFSINNIFHESLVKLLIQNNYYYILIVSVQNKKTN